MKRYNAILLGLIIIGIGYYFWSKEGKYLNTDIYFVGGKAYSIFTDKKISGEILSKDDTGVYYRQYKDGIIKSEKIVDENMMLVKKSSFNKLGLLEGELYDKSGYNHNRTEQTLNYKNNILQGKSEIGNNPIYFIDGTINGPYLLRKYSKMDKIINYKEGVPDFIELDIPSSEYPKNLLINALVPEKFNGGIFQNSKKKSQDVIKLSEYQDGILIRERFYNNGSNKLNLVGIKLQDIFYHKNGKISKQLVYSDEGRLQHLSSYDINGLKHGLVIGNHMVDETVILNYSSDVLNGKYEEYSVTKDNTIQKLSGVYKLGIYSGQKLRYGKIENYLDGVKVENIDLDKIIGEEKKVIEEMEEIPEKFTGFNRVDSLTINEYIEGKVFKQYFINGENKVTIETKEVRDNGSYIYNTYVDGFIITQREFDELNSQNVKYIEYFYKGEDSCSKTIFNMVNGKILGESIHYHGDDKVMYKDIYNPDETYTRTYYSDYENNEIGKTVTGRKINGVWVEDAVQEKVKEYTGKYTYGHEVRVFTDEKTGQDYWIYGNVDSLELHMSKLMNEKKAPYVELKVKIKGIDTGKADNGLAEETDKQMEVKEYSIIE